MPPLLNLFPLSPIYRGEGDTEGEVNRQPQYYCLDSSQPVDYDSEGFAPIRIRRR
jgi:hypothetical protein